MWEWKKYPNMTLAEYLDGAWIVYNPENKEAYLTTHPSSAERVIAEIKNGKVVGSKKPLEWWMKQLDKQYDKFEAEAAEFAKEPRKRNRRR